MYTAVLRDGCVWVEQDGAQLAAHGAFGKGVLSRTGGQGANHELAVNMLTTTDHVRNLFLFHFIFVGLGYCAYFVLA